MAYSDQSATQYSPSPSPTSAASDNRWSLLPKDTKGIEECEVVQGRVLWLPPKDELPTKAVRRAHGKGAVEEGIYNHPIVVISRPEDVPEIVHFHLITSFQGKKLHEIYGKANEFHASRRSWYLPIAPAPDHPDANSKKSKKRFPTLELAGGGTLRWDSYVNLRHVYKIDWTLLRPYSNLDTPFAGSYQFERESMIRMLAKGRIVTTYETGTQYQRPVSPQFPISYIHTRDMDEESKPLRSPTSDSTSTTTSQRSSQSPPPRSDFLDSAKAATGSTRRPPREPPDQGEEDPQTGIVRFLLRYLLYWPLVAVKRLWAGFRFWSHQ